MSVVVIGSGPAGVAAAHALAHAGHHVCVVDAGDTIEPERMATFDKLAELEPESWPVGLAQSARGSFPVTARRVPLKPAYGSLFPYALDDMDLPVTRDGVETLPSLAVGGLSNAWGASVLPVRERDIDDWPIALEDLVPHYAAVLRFMPLAAESDELAEVLPLYTSEARRLRRTPQMDMVLSHLRAHSSPLRAAGFSFGGSRLALDASDDSPNRCRYGGMCLYGCPYHAIYNAAHTLEQLIHERGVVYRGGVYVDRLVSADGGVTIQAHERRRPASRVELTASRVFVACGAVSSTRLMLASMGREPQSLRLRDSQYFLIPMANARSVPVCTATQGNTLAQVFLELEDDRVSRHSAHLQLYGYNDLMLAPIASKLPVGIERLERGLRPLVGRMIVMQGYLHSGDSPGMTLELKADGVRLLGDDPAEGIARVRRLVRRLTANAHLLGMAPIPGLTQLGRPGKGNHVGGSLPMRHRPSELETDTMGRVPGWDRVHVVDSSVLPSLPATTVTLSVMANAHRIAAAAAVGAD